jgi:hypothetical protein
VAAGALVAAGASVGAAAPPPQAVKARDARTNTLTNDHRDDFLFIVPFSSLEPCMGVASTTVQYSPFRFPKLAHLLPTLDYGMIDE